MSNYPDLATLFKNGMGSMAALQAGQMQGQASQAAELEQMYARQKMQQEAMMHPLNMQMKQGQIAQQQAELPGVVGQSQSHAVKGQLDQATAQTKLAEILSAGVTKLGEDGVKQMAMEGERLGQAAQLMLKAPPMMHKQILESYISKFGGDPNSPTIKHLLSLPDGQIAAAADTLSKSMALATGKQRQASALQAEDNSVKERIAKGHDQTQIKVAQIQAEARKQIAAERQNAVRHMNMDQAITYLSGIPEDQRTPAEQAQLVQLSKQRLAERTASANAVPAQVMNMETPQARAQGTAEQIHGAQPQASGVPTGYKQIGTHKGKPVYQDAQGNKFIAE